MINLIHGDCLVEMRNIPDKSVDMVLTDQKKRVFSKKHRENISRSCKGRVAWSKGKTMPKSSLYKNMVAHLRFKVDLSWITQFEDINKLKCLNDMATDRGRGVIHSVEMYMEYVEKFYNDEKFNSVYFKWIETKDRLLKPTIDHIVPKSRGGLNKIENYQVLSWFENRCKNNMSQSEWDNLKNNIKDYLS